MTDLPPASGPYVFRPDLYLAPVINVREAYGGWILGRLRKSGAVIEMSWELWPKLQPFNMCLGSTCIVNIRVMLEEETLFEWGFGQCFKQPDPRVAKELNTILTMLADKQMSTVPDRRERYAERAIPDVQGAQSGRFSNICHQGPDDRPVSGPHHRRGPSKLASRQRRGARAR